jgi:hypothetical protein
MISDMRTPPALVIACLTSQNSKILAASNRFSRHPVPGGHVPARAASLVG